MSRATFAYNFCVTILFIDFCIFFNFIYIASCLRNVKSTLAWENTTTLDVFQWATCPSKSRACRHMVMRLVEWLYQFLELLGDGTQATNVLLCVFVSSQFLTQLGTCQTRYGLLFASAVTSHCIGKFAAFRTYKGYFTLQQQYIYIYHISAQGRNYCVYG